MKIFDHKDNTKSGIYKIVNIVSNKYYIGSAKCFINRWKVHESHLRLDKHHNIKLQNSYNFHGPDAFQFEILELCEYEKDIIVERENYWIAKLDSKVNGYNIADASFGDTLTNHPRRDEIIKGWSEARKGRTLNPEWRKALSDSTKGRALSESHRQKISKANTGRKHSTATKLKMSKAHSGKNLSEKHKENLKIAAKTRPPVSPETGLKISKALSGRTRSAEHSKALSISKTKWRYEVTIDGKLYDGPAAAKLLGCHLATIANRSISDKYPNYIRKEFKS